jgi:hypothetical protein
LGAAHYRNGNWQEALDAFDKSMKLSSSGSGFGWFFVSMAHWQLGHNSEARDWYEKAVEWMDKNQPKNDELLRFRAEADDKLGFADSKPAGESTSQPASAPQP